MKNAKEWAKLGYILTSEIKQIQLDAMREGMRRAASVCILTIDENGMADAAECRDRILSAAEQLTEKDL